MRKLCLSNASHESIQKLHSSDCGSKWIPPIFQDIEEMERHGGDGPCSSSSLKQTTGEHLTSEPGDQQPPQLQLPQMKTSTFKKLKKRLRSKVKGGASKKKSNSPFLEPSHRHSSVDMNGEFTCLFSPVFKDSADSRLMFLINY